MYSTTPDVQIVAVPAIIGLVLGIVMLVAQWKIYTKAGEKGWKCLIPIYNTYILFKLCWKTSMFGVFVALAFVYGILSGLAQSVSILGIVAFVVMLAVLVMEIMLYNKLAKSFGKGAGYTVGLILLPVVFLPMLAFGSAKYIGNTSM